MRPISPKVCNQNVSTDAVECRERCRLQPSSTVDCNCQRIHKTKQSRAMRGQKAMKPRLHISRFVRRPAAWRNRVRCDGDWSAANSWPHSVMPAVRYSATCGERPCVRHDDVRCIHLDLVGVVNQMIAGLRACGRAAAAQQPVNDIDGDERSTSTENSLCVSTNCPPHPVHRRRARQSAN